MSLNLKNFKFRNSFSARLIRAGKISQRSLMFRFEKGKILREAKNRFKEYMYVLYFILLPVTVFRKGKS